MCERKWFICKYDDWRWVGKNWTLISYSTLTDFTSLLLCLLLSFADLTDNEFAQNV